LVVWLLEKSCGHWRWGGESEQQREGGQHAKVSAELKKVRPEAQRPEIHYPEGCCQEMPQQDRRNRKEKPGHVRKRGEESGVRVRKERQSRG